MLCTTLHLPNESRTALELFADGLMTPSFEQNGFYKLPDFMELSRRFGLMEKRATAIMKRFQTSCDAVASLIDRSLLSAKAKNRYLALIRDRLQAIAD